MQSQLLYKLFVTLAASLAVSAGGLHGGRMSNTTSVLGMAIGVRNKHDVDSPASYRRCTKLMQCWPHTTVSCLTARTQHSEQSPYVVERRLSRSLPAPTPSPGGGSGAAALVTPLRASGRGPRGVSGRAPLKLPRPRHGRQPLLLLLLPVAEAARLLLLPPGCRTKTFPPLAPCRRAGRLRRQHGMLTLCIRG